VLLKARRVLFETVSALFRGSEYICRGFESSCIGQEGIVENFECCTNRDSLFKS
jgi:hypothetical protein